MTDRTVHRLVLLLTVTVFVLLAANVGLFWRMRQLQGSITRFIQSMAQASQPPAALAAGNTAPTFELASTAGDLVSLEQFAGRPLLLGFSSTSCSACEVMYPALRTLQEAHPDLALVLVSEGPEEANRQLASHQGFSFPILAWQDEVARAYEVPGTPYFFAIDHGGVIRAAGTASSAPALEALLDAVG